MTYGRPDEPQTQSVCPCCVEACPSGCASALPELRTESCPVSECRCWGTTADGGLCEGCYLWTK